jgi:hypothetical protein
MYLLPSVVDCRVSVLQQDWLGETENENNKKSMMPEYFYWSILNM